MCAIKMITSFISYFVIGAISNYAILNVVDFKIKSQKTHGTANNAMMTLKPEIE